MGRVAIIGAGIGGLTLAVALKRKGIKAQVFESAEKIKAVGAGIWMPPNAMDILDRLDVGQDVRENGYELKQMDVRDYNDKLISRVDGSWLKQNYGNSSISIERSLLHQQLEKKLDTEQIQIGQRCQGIKFHENNVYIQLKDRWLPFDCIIGADGLHSTVRRSLFPERKVRYTGQTCFRGLVLTDSIPELQNGAAELWGHGSRFGLSPVSTGKYYWYATLASNAGVIRSKSEVIQLLRKEFLNFPQYITNLIDKIECTGVNELIQTDLFDLDPEGNWVSNQIALIGDAAHATTPNLGQGAAMAIEDAYVLANEFTGDNFEIHKAYLQYYERRKSRVSFIVNTSWKVGKMSMSKNKLLNSIRNKVMQRIPKGIMQKQLDKIYRSEIV